MTALPDWLAARPWTIPALFLLAAVLAAYWQGLFDLHRHRGIRTSPAERAQRIEDSRAAARKTWREYDARLNSGRLAIEAAPAADVTLVGIGHPSPNWTQRFGEQRTETMARVTDDPPGDPAPRAYAMQHPGGRNR